MVTLPNISDPAFLEDPFPFFEMGRQMSPLRLPNMDMFMAFGYDECVTMLKDHATWSSQNPQMAEGDGPGMLGSDPPRHTRLRALVSQAFTPRMVEQLEPRIRQIAAELLAPAMETGECDLVETLSYPLPVIVIAEILGIPPEDRGRFKLWSDEVVRTLGTGVGGGPGQQVDEALFEEMRAYLLAMAEERRKNPKSDLISGLVQAEMDGEKLTSEELVAMLILLLVAGNETTTNLIGNTALEFMAHPDEFAKVLADPGLIPSALEEVLRFNSPVQATVRRPTRDVELSGKPIPQAIPVVVWLAAANRDPGHFPDPQRFDITRTPNRHIAFGLGVHFCLGAPLARLEARVAVEELLKRVKGFERTTQGPLPRVPTFIMRGVTSLPVSLHLK